MAEVEVESKQEPNEIQANSEGSPKRAKSKSRSGSPSPHRSRSPHSRSSRSPSPDARRRNSSPQRREQQPHAPPTKTLFVRGVPSGVPDVDVIDLFKQEQGYADLRRVCEQRGGIVELTPTLWNCPTYLTHLELLNLSPTWYSCRFATMWSLWIMTQLKTLQVLSRIYKVTSFKAHIEEFTLILTEYVCGMCGMWWTYGIVEVPRWM